MTEEPEKTVAQQQLEAIDHLANKSVRRPSMKRSAAYWQNRRTIELLESMNKGIDVLVAAEYANAQATEGLMQAFEGSGKDKSTEAFYNQRLLRRE